MKTTPPLLLKQIIISQSKKVKTRAWEVKDNDLTRLGA